MSTLSDEQLTAEIPADAGYEALVAMLESVVEQLETGDLPLEQALAAYERGVELVRRCNTLLDGAELRVTELSSDLTQRTAPSPDDSFSPRFLFDDDDFDDE